MLRFIQKHSTKELRTENDLLRTEHALTSKELRTENQQLHDSHKKLDRRIAELHPKSRPVPEGALDEKRKFYRQDEVARMFAVGKRQVRNYLGDKELTRAAKSGWVLNDEKLRSLYSSMSRPKEVKV